MVTPYTYRQTSASNEISDLRYRTSLRYQQSQNTKLNKSTAYRLVFEKSKAFDNLSPYIKCKKLGQMHLNLLELGIQLNKIWVWTLEVSGVVEDTRLLYNYDNGGNYKIKSSKHEYKWQKIKRKNNINHGHSGALGYQYFHHWYQVKIIQVLALVQSQISSFFQNTVIFFWNQLIT